MRASVREKKISVAYNVFVTLILVRNEGRRHFVTGSIIMYFFCHYSNAWRNDKYGFMVYRVYHNREAFERQQCFSAPLTAAISSGVMRPEML